MTDYVWRFVQDVLLGSLGSFLWYAGLALMRRARSAISSRRERILEPERTEAFQRSFPDPPLDTLDDEQDAYDAIAADMAARMAREPLDEDFDELSDDERDELLELAAAGPPRTPTVETGSCADCKHWSLDEAVRVVERDPTLRAMRESIGAYWNGPGADARLPNGAVSRGVRFTDLGRCMAERARVDLTERSHSCPRYAPGIRPRLIQYAGPEPFWPEHKQVMRAEDMPLLEPHPGDENAPSLVGFPPEVQAIEDAFVSERAARGAGEDSGVFRDRGPHLALVQEFTPAPADDPIRARAPAGQPLPPLAAEITRESPKLPSEPPTPTTRRPS